MASKSSLQKVRAYSAATRAVLEEAQMEDRNDVRIDLGEGKLKKPEEKNLGIFIFHWISLGGTHGYIIWVLVTNQK